MNDEQFLAEFDACTLASGTLHHRDHVRVAWIYLERFAPLEALGRFTASLRRYAAAQGQPELYHVTITWAFLLLIEERRNTAAPGEPWEEFAARNPDLLGWKPSVLRSPRARAGFVWPDRIQAL
ncbi:MAG: hypothetical protein ABI609_04640 [Acidobacteriota bacterium]